MFATVIPPVERFGRRDAYAFGLHFSDVGVFFFSGQLTHCHWNCVKVFIFNLFWGTEKGSNGQQAAVVKDEPDRENELFLVMECQGVLLVLGNTNNAASSSYLSGIPDEIKLEFSWADRKTLHTF
jgi:hypothetical protein